MLKGMCLCGATRYEVADEFEYAMNCHCSKCRRATGSAFKPMGGIAVSKIKITSQSAGLLNFGGETARDIHCGSCGSLIYSVVREGKYAHVTFGTLLDAPSRRPDHHIHVASKAPWHEITDELPQHNEFP